MVSIPSDYLSCYNVSTVSVAGGRYRLRSNGSAAYVLPRTRTRFGERGFFYSGPAAWNTLPSDLHDITDTSTFRKRLKNVLFDGAYHLLLLALLDMSYSGALQILCWLIDWLIATINLYIKFEVSILHPLRKHEWRYKISKRGLFGVVRVTQGH